jgi:phosphoribosylformimino-5-aminoimidazole carboxamide ribotide isomerase
MGFVFLCILYSYFLHHLNIHFDLIPAIDLKGGKCVRLQEGDAARATEYGDDPLAMAIHWEQQGARRLHLVDLDGAFSGGPVHLDAARAIFRRLRIPVQFGGGVRSLEAIERLLEAGAGRVILGTVAVEQPELVESAVVLWGGAIVVGIDARQGRVAVRGWTEGTSIAARDLAARVRAAGVERVVYTDVARDGMMTGPNVDETEALARETGVRVLASGGVAALDDVRKLWERRASGIEGVVIGRALYERRLEFREAAELYQC